MVGRKGALQNAYTIKLTETPVRLANPSLVVLQYTTASELNF